MMRTSSRGLRAGIAAAAALTLSAFAPTTASAQFSSIYFFGDSYTDTGNGQALALGASLPNPTPSPYFSGRFSNGQAWSEFFATKLGLGASAGPAWIGGGNNYAVGGATTGVAGYLGSPTGMISQAARFGTDLHPGFVPSTSLFVLWGGGNDIINAVSLLTPQARALAVTTAVGNIVGLANSLRTNLGVTNFLIPLLPNVGATPTYGIDPIGAAIASDLTNQFNTQLGAFISQIDAVPGVNAWSLNLNNLLTNIGIDAATGGTRYGITNTTIPCFTLPNPAVTCDASLFVDGLHGTTRVQKLIADAAYNRVTLGVDVALLPEPSTWVLMAAGLAATAVVARKRKRA